MSCFVLASDLHLTKREDDEYRWRVFPFLAKVAKSYGTNRVVISGDLVDKKDHHPASLVHRIVKELKDQDIDWTILMGNHDYVEPSEPFFGFLDELDNVEYVLQPSPLTIEGSRCLLVPHNRDWHGQAEWRERFPLSGGDKPYDYIITHQTFAGSMASNGQEMKGVPLATVSAKACAHATVLSGDIHVPQKIGNVVYVGSPHPVNFGDDFTPRVLVVRPDGFDSVNNSACIARHMLKLTVKDLEGWGWAESLFEEDQAKVQLTLTRAQAMDVQVHRDAVVSKLAKLGVHHYGTDIEIVADDVQDDAVPEDTGELLRATPENVFEQYVEHRGLEDAVAAAGRAYL